MSTETSRNVWLLSTAQGIGSIISMSNMAHVMLAAALLADRSFATIPVAITTIVMALSTIPLSQLMRVTSRRTGLMFGAGCSVASGTITMVALDQQSFFLLCVGAAALGPAMAATVQNRFVAIESVPAERASRAISLTLAGSVGGILLVPFLTDSAEELFAPATYFGIYVLITILAFVLMGVLAFLKPVAVSEEARAGGGRPLGEIMRQPNFVCAVTCSTAGFAAMVLVMTATPLAMQSAGFAAATSTKVIQWHALAMYLPSFFTGHLLARFGTVRVVYAGLLVLAIGVVAALSGENLVSFAISLITMGLGWNFLFIGGTTLLTTTYTVREKARVQGTHEFIVFSTQAAAALAAGALLAIFGWQMIQYGVLVVVAFVAVIVAWYARQKVGPDPHSKAVDYGDAG